MIQLLQLVLFLYGESIIIIIIIIIMKVEVQFCCDVLLKFNLIGYSCFSMNINGWEGMLFLGINAAIR